MPSAPFLVPIFKHILFQSCNMQVHKYAKANRPALFMIEHYKMIILTQGLHRRLETHTWYRNTQETVMIFEYTVEVEQSTDKHQQCA